MKKIKLIFIVLSTISLFGVDSVNAQADSEQQFVTIEVTEPTGMGPKAEMIVIDNNGKIASSELDKVILGEYIETSGKNTVAVHNEIKKWTKKGYKILTYDKEIGVYRQMHGYLLTTIVLVKD
ncbi:MAG TPA: hypothetical protein VKY37_00500 [Brumimicrobium sp.]|nr:hypothetical protein [Brumimicrobium sp.]